MKTLTKEQELKIIKSAERVVDLVKQGQHPNDALYKVALDEKLQPEFVKRLAEVFNTSRILAHFKSASPERRADSFPLADWGEVLSRLYPKSEVKAASVDHWFAAPPDFTRQPTALFPKAASSNVNNPINFEFLVKQARNHLDALKRELDVLHTDLENCRELIRQNLDKAVYYFKQADHKPYDEVESNFLSAAGPLGRPLMDVLYHLCGGEKFGEKRGSIPRRKQLFDLEEEPYNYLFNCIKTAKDLSSAKIEYNLKKQELEHFETQFNDKLRKLALLRRPNRIPFPFKDIQKSAALKALIGYAVGRGFNSQGKNVSSLLDIIDPMQEVEERNLKIRLVLHELMNNDPIISNYPEEEVIKAYNELLSLAPRVAEKPALTRALLARRLELGHIDPFELSQVIKTEENIKKIDKPEVPTPIINKVLEQNTGSSNSFISSSSPRSKTRTNEQ